MIRRLLRAPALLALPLALLAGACSERLQTADGCPVLCPGQTFDILDTILDPAIVGEDIPVISAGATDPMLPRSSAWWGRWRTRRTPMVRR